MVYCPCIRAGKEDMVPNKIRKNDHIVIHGQIEEGVYEGTVHREDGRVDEAVLDARGSGGGGSSQVFEKCASSPDGVVALHLAKPKGPARWNSAVYCEGWDRIFGKRDEHGVN